MRTERITRRGLFALIGGVASAALVSSAAAAPLVGRVRAIKGLAPAIGIVGGSRALKDDGGAPSAPDSIITGDIELNDCYDIRSGCWIVTGFRIVDGVRYGVGVVVHEGPAQILAARQYVAKRLLEPAEDLCCPIGASVRFEQWPKAVMS